MRPYLAVIKDSFREAFASRILSILLVFFTVVLIALVPFGISEESAWELSRRDILNGKTLLHKMRKQSESDESSPGKHIWNFISEDLTQQLPQSEQADSSESESEDKLRKELNRILQRKDFYDSEAWEHIELKAECQRFLTEGIDNLSGDNFFKFNRLLLEAAYPAEIAVSPQSRASVSWAGFDVGSNFFQMVSMDGSQVRDFVKGCLVLISTWLVAKFGVLVAILVSANIIPQMFEAGSIDLLLSKPVSRTLLFLTKFFSGCTFILVNAGYFMIGLWLIAGLRMGIWSSGLLLSIPVFLFVFSILYSVAALLSVVFKSPIISVLFTVALWFFCNFLGVTKEVVDVFRNADKLATIVPAGESLIVSNKNGKIFRWAPNTEQWKEIFQDDGSSPPMLGFFTPIIGPVYDLKKDRILAIHNTNKKLLFGQRSENWTRMESIPAKGRARFLYVTQNGEIITIGPTGIFSLKSIPNIPKPVDNIAEENSTAFINIAPEEVWIWGIPFTAAMNVANDSLVVYHGGKISKLERSDDGKYQIKMDTDLETTEPAVLAFSDKEILVALESGEILVFDTQSLNKRESFRPFGKQEPKFAVISPDGRWFGVLFHHKRFWLYDSRTKQEVTANLSRQGNITAVAFSASGKLFIADRIHRVVQYELDRFRLERQFVGDRSTRDMVYDFGINPLYIILPKPGQLDNVISYFFTGEKSGTLPGNENDLQAERFQLDIWTPVWSNLAFLAVMLSLTCWYISRRDF